MIDASTFSFLRKVLLLDAVATGATALFLALGGGFLAGHLGLPETLLRGAGLFLVLFVAFVAWVATRDHPSASLSRTVAGLNVAWVVASLLLLVSHSVAPTLLGYVFVVAQALAVGVFAELQVVGLRRARAASA